MCMVGESPYHASQDKLRRIAANRAGCPRFVIGKKRTCLKLGETSGFGLEWTPIRAWVHAAAGGRACLTRRDLCLGRIVQFSNAAINLTDYVLRERPEV